MHVAAKLGDGVQILAANAGCSTPLPGRDLPQRGKTASPGARYFVDTSEEAAAADNCPRRREQTSCAHLINGRNNKVFGPFLGISRPISMAQRLLFQQVDRTCHPPPERKPL